MADWIEKKWKARTSAEMLKKFWLCENIGVSTFRFIYTVTFFQGKCTYLNILVSWNNVKEPGSYTSVLYIHCTAANIWVFLITEITETGSSNDRVTEDLIYYCNSNIMDCHCRTQGRAQVCYPCIWYDANRKKKKRKKKAAGLHPKASPLAGYKGR